MQKAKHHNERGEARSEKRETRRMEHREQSRLTPSGPDHASASFQTFIHQVCTTAAETASCNGSRNCQQE
eukprot:3933766-Rhodomonas_salina.3